MISKKEMETLAKYLKQKREERNIDLEEISRITRIKKVYLEALEEEKDDVLPATYIKGILKAYAKEVGLNPQEVLRHYQKAHQEGLKKPEILPPKRRFSPGYYIGGVILFLLVGVSVYFLAISKKAPLPEKEKIPQVVVKPSPKPPLQEKEKKVVLKVEGVSLCWMRVQIDDNPPFELFVRPGQSLSWEAKEGYRLRLGDAGGVKLYLNDKPLGIPGELGEVMNLALPSG